MISITTHSIEVTPKLLREIGEYLDMSMAKAKTGQHTPSYAFYGDNGLVVRLVADQDAYHCYKTNQTGWI